MNKEEFLKIKEAYKSARTEERKSIIGFITKKKDKEGNFLLLSQKINHIPQEINIQEAEEIKSTPRVVDYLGHMIYQITCGLICHIKEMTF